MNGFAQKSSVLAECSAEGAGYGSAKGAGYESQGQAQSASPLVTNQNFISSPERA